MRSWSHFCCLHSGREATDDLRIWIKGIVPHMSLIKATACANQQSQTVGISELWPLESDLPGWTLGAFLLTEKKKKKRKRRVRLIYKSTICKISRLFPQYRALLWLSSLWDISSITITNPTHFFSHHHACQLCLPPPLLISSLLDLVFLCLCLVANNYLLLLLLSHVWLFVNLWIAACQASLSFYLGVRKFISEGSLQILDQLSSNSRLGDGFNLNGVPQTGNCRIILGQFFAHTPHTQ